ncbi:MAG: ATP-binding protein [Phenylobacterium sp.]|nr:ATP-binding protein [Phenylobacterium sp.]
MAKLETHLEAAGAPVAAVSAVMIAVDELVTNVQGHGGAARVTVDAVVADDRISVMVEDDGAAFDPLAAKTPDTTASVESRQIGGLGIHLVRTMMDDIAYAREGGLNRLRISKLYGHASTSPDATGEAS